MISIILAAGQGTRIRSLTGGQPKQMLRIVGEPIIVRLLRQVSAVGATRHFLSTHTDSTLMTDYLRSLSNKYGDAALMPSLPSKGQNLVALLRIAGPPNDDVLIAMGDSVFHESLVPICKSALADAFRADICLAVASRASASSGRQFDLASRRVLQKGATIGVPYTGLAVLRPHIGLTLVELGERSIFTSMCDAINAMLDRGATVSVFDVGEYFDVNTPDAYEQCVAAIR